MISAAKELSWLCGFFDRQIVQSAVCRDAGALRQAKKVIVAMSDEELLELADEN